MLTIMDGPLLDVAIYWTDIAILSNINVPVNERYLSVDVDKEQHSKVDGLSNSSCDKLNSHVSAT